MTVYTLTMNPAIDYITTVVDDTCADDTCIVDTCIADTCIADTVVGGVKRCVASVPARFIAAGKGVNVSFALKRAGVESVAVCLCGDGFVSNEFVRQLSVIESVIVRSFNCDTRINVKLIGKASNSVACNSITETNGSFCVDEQSVIQVVTKLRELLREGDVLIMSGSLPYGVATDFYANLAAEFSAKGVLTVVDTSGEPLAKVVESEAAWLIAPNEHELKEVGQVSGINVLASYGEKGAILTASGKTYTCCPESVLNGYTVGAGDNLLAGFIAEYIKSEDYEKALAFGVQFASEYINGAKIG